MVSSLLVVARLFFMGFNFDEKLKYISAIVNYVLSLNIGHDTRPLKKALVKYTNLIGGERCDVMDNVRVKPSVSKIGRNIMA